MSIPTYSLRNVIFDIRQNYWHRVSIIITITQKLI